MRKKPQPPLWIYFAKRIFFMMIAGGCFVSAIAILFYRSNFVNMRHGQPLGVGIFFVIFSIITGMSIALIVGRQILRPISQLSSEMRNVAEGDFSIQLKESHNISELEQLFHDFNTMVRELNTIETLRDDFVTNVSHEFKTPIATIRGYVQLLQNTDLSEAERQEYLNRILDGTRQLSQLTENILKLTKIETQGVVLDEEDFRLDEQIRNVILFLEPEWEALNIEWNIELEKCYYHGSEEFLYQVWLNIIGNAIKYNREDGEIRVQLTDKEDVIEVEVQDTGIGMDETTVKHVFDKFFQADTTRKTKGNGLGLTLAQRIIEIYGGTIQVSSEKNTGTQMIVRLPKKISKNKQIVHN